VKKLTLTPDALRVESFPTAQEQSGLAHVRDEADGRFGTSVKINCIPCTESPTCRCV